MYLLKSSHILCCTYIRISIYGGNLQRMTVPVYWYFGTWLCVFTEILYDKMGTDSVCRHNTMKLELVIL